MAKFCGNCGMQLEDDARVCGNCGTPYAGDEERNNSFAPQTKKKIKKIAILSGIGVVVIIIGIIAINIASYMNGYERTISTFYKALNDFDLETMFSVTYEANSYVNYDSFDEYEKIFSSAMSNVLDSYESQVGHDVKVSYEIVDSYKYSDRKFQNFLTNLEETYHYDTSDISEVYSVSVKTIITGSSSSKTLSTGDVNLIKDNGKWYIYGESAALGANTSLLR